MRERSERCELLSAAAARSVLDGRQRAARLPTSDPAWWPRGAKIALSTSAPTPRSSCAARRPRGARIGDGWGLVRSNRIESNRLAQVPFIVYNSPDADKTVRTWSSAGALEARLGKRRFAAEKSEDNHFMYYSHGGGSNKGWAPPVGSQSLSIGEWHEVPQQPTEEKPAERRRRSGGQ